MLGVHQSGLLSIQEKKNSFTIASQKLVWLKEVHAMVKLHIKFANTGCIYNDILYSAEIYRFDKLYVKHGLIFSFLCFFSCLSYFLLSMLLDVHGLQLLFISRLSFLLALRWSKDLS